MSSVTDAWVLAVLLGVLQGVVEWVPISSEGVVTLVNTGLGADPAVAVQLALFLHLGTAIAATAYYRGEFVEAALALRPGAADRRLVWFLVAATLVSGVVGVGAYALFVDVASALTGGAVVAVIGGLLIVTGLVQRFADARLLGERATPDLLDAVVVGVGQGLAILPGISRSGTTVSVLLWRGHTGESAFDLSFLLSVPAAAGAAGLTLLESNGVPGIDPMPAALAVAASAVVGYLTIDALLRVVRRVAFWAVCLGLGGLALVGGGLVVLA